MDLNGSHKPTNITINVGNPNLYPSIDDFTTFFFPQMLHVFSTNMSHFGHQVSSKPEFILSDDIPSVSAGFRWPVEPSEDVALWLFNLAMANHTFFEVNHYKSSINGSCFIAMLNNQRVFAKKSWSRPTTLIVKLIDDKQLHFFSTPHMAPGPWSPGNLVWLSITGW